MSRTFTYMHQKTLVQIAVNLPDSLSALAGIKGIGKRLAEKYGAELVALVSAYRRENNILEVPAVEGGHRERVQKNRKRGRVIQRP